jgi:hypothetical protein
VNIFWVSSSKEEEAPMKPIKTQDVPSIIYRLRGRQVMLDVDLAQLYGVATKNLNKAVRRNLIRFPVDFMFRISFREAENMRFQIGTSRWGGRRYLPYAFTEEGVAMLSSVLRSQRAALVNIAIMRAFVRLRHAVLSSRDVARRVEKLEGKVEMHETDIRLILEDMNRLRKKSIPDGPIPPIII